MSPLRAEEPNGVLAHGFQLLSAAVQLAQCVVMLCAVNAAGAGNDCTTQTLEGVGEFATLVAIAVVFVSAVALAVATIDAGSSGEGVVVKPPPPTTPRRLCRCCQFLRSTPSPLPQPQWNRATSAVVATRGDPPPQARPTTVNPLTVCSRRAPESDRLRAAGNGRTACRTERVSPQAVTVRGDGSSPILVPLHS
jgi:hypothetical protein